MFRAARRAALWLHAPRAWLNEQLTLARDGARRGDAEGLALAHARRWEARRLARSATIQTLGDGQAVS